VVVVSITWAMAWMTGLILFKVCVTEGITWVMNSNECTCEFKAVAVGDSV
jgi:hypothetical protein